MKDWKNLVKSIAPALATAFGGPLAGLATKAVSDGLLGKEDGTDGEIYEALLNPEGLEKLKQIEADFKVRMKQLDVDLEKLAVSDRGSARGLAKDTGAQPQVILSAIFIGGFFVVLWVLFSGDVVLTDSMEKLAYLLLGVLSSGVTMVLKFWFGGSPHDGTNMQNIYNSIPREQLKK